MLFKKFIDLQTGLEFFFATHSSSSSSSSSFFAALTDCLLLLELHSSMCGKRNLATIGSHDLARIKPPFYYEGRAPKDIFFTPLRSDKPCQGDELEKLFQESNDGSMLKYLSIIKSSPLWPIFADSTKEVLCLPPVINGTYSQISIETKDILLEVTSANSIQTCHEIMQALIMGMYQLFSKEGNPDNKLVLEQVKVVSEGGALKILFPSQRDIAELDELAWKTENEK
jgi:phenylalanyl-tRNA synthetase beta chain